MDDITQLRKQFDLAWRQLDIDRRSMQADALRSEVEDPQFWQTNTQPSAQAKVKRLASEDALLQPWVTLNQQLTEIAEFVGLGDESLANDLQKRIEHATAEFIELKKQLRFSGPHDTSNAIVSIWAGAGGLDAQDWAGMLRRMYLRWAESVGMQVSVLDESHGEEGGLKSTSLAMSGAFAYGQLKSEHGVHRLVRLSPFNSAHSRETSFAMVEVVPEVDSPDEIELNENDIRVDVFRAGGHGGQSVNTTDSAVRITHLPTGIVVSIQNERSQIQNKETAFTILKSKLAALAEEQHKETLDELKGPNQEAAWGNQIRSYVLHPYTLVKDARSNYQTSDAQAVLDGDLSPLIEEYLEANLGKA